MAIIRKFSLSWKASCSGNIIGYRLYWDYGARITYDSRYIEVGNVTETELPDDVSLTRGPVLFGVTAVDTDGNESDLNVIAEPFQLHVPNAPPSLSIQPADAFVVTQTSPKEKAPPEVIQDLFPRQEKAEEEEETEEVPQFDIGAIW